MKRAGLWECGDLSPLSERQEHGAATSSAEARFGLRLANRANERRHVPTRTTKRRQVAALQRGFAGSRTRRGVSLLEVLISIFVLSIGLLGVAAVIPVAGHEILQATKADVGSACGQAALADIKVRGALNPGEWRGFNVSTGNWSTIGTTKPPPPSNPPYHDARRGYEFGESYAIDALYVAETTKVSGASSSNFADFPYNPSNPGTPVGGRWTRMQRVTWSGVGLNRLLARSVFKWHDDLEFTAPADQDERPRPMLEVLRTPTSGLERRPFPALPHEPPISSAFQSDFKGNYSWLVTVTPLPEHIDFVDVGGTGLPYSYPENSPVYTVSVAVFYKRDMSAPKEYSGTGVMVGETPGERQVRLDFLGTGLGGGDVRLYVFGDATNPITLQPANYLDVKENEWLLVSGFYDRACYFYNDLATPPQSSLYPPLRVGVHKWYRIVAAGEIVVEDQNGNATLDTGEDSDGDGVLDPPYREVTLAGPDWNAPNWCVDKGQPPLSRKRALGALFKGVVGVYSTDMKLY